MTTNNVNAKVSKKSVTVSTRRFEFAHGRQPRGRGLWGFELEGVEELMFVTGSFSDAKKAAVEAAAKMGVRRVSVAS